MPESRDRLSRPEEVSMIFARRRRNIHDFGIFFDEPAASFVRTPFRWGATPMTGFHGQGGQAAATSGVGVGVPRRGSFVTPRRAIGRGRENILSSWYPRAPLRDITAATRAIERRRERSRETEGLQLGTPTPQGLVALNPLYAEPTLNNAQFEHLDLHISPTTAAKEKPCHCPPSVAKSEEREDPDFLTPQLKFLDTVGRELMEKLEKMKNTPAAKRAARDKKIRVLMSMR